MSGRPDLWRTSALEIMLPPLLYLGHPKNLLIGWLKGEGGMIPHQQFLDPSLHNTRALQVSDSCRFQLDVGRC